MTTSRSDVIGHAERPKEQPRCLHCLQCHVQSTIRRLRAASRRRSHRSKRAVIDGVVSPAASPSSLLRLRTDFYQDIPDRTVCPVYSGDLAILDGLPNIRIDVFNATTSGIGMATTTAGATSDIQAKRGDYAMLSKQGYSCRGGRQLVNDDRGQGTSLFAFQVKFPRQETSSSQYL
jgi:hypothetical protein